MLIILEFVARVQHHSRGYVYKLSDRQVVNICSVTRDVPVVSKFVGPVGQSDISYECPTKNVGVPDQMSDRNYKKISI